MITAIKMGKVKYATGIDYVSGSLSKPTVKDGHSCGTYLIGTHRNAATTSKHCTRIYVRDADAYDRTKPLSQDEQAARIRFTAVTQAVAARRKDLQKITADQQAFAAQKDSPTGKKTMFAYLWMVCGDEYDQTH